MIGRTADSAEYAAARHRQPQRYRPYPAYKDSGVEWLGAIPAHWETRQLKRLFHIRNGSTPKSSEATYWDGDVTWITPEDLGESNQKAILRSRRSITEAGLRSCGTTLVPAGSIVLSSRAPIGYVAIAGVDLCTNQGCRSLVHRQTLSETYYFYYLLTVGSELTSLGQGSTYMELSRHDLSALVVIRPDFHEQEAIAEFLDRETAKIDALVAKKERLIKLLREKRTALITQAVTKGLDLDMPMKDSSVEWLGKIPAHWDVLRCKQVCTVRRGASPRPIDDPIYFDENGEYGWVRIADVTASGRYLENTTEYLSVLGKSKSVPLNSGELIISIAASVGKPIITKIKCCIHDGFVHLGDSSEDREYLYYVFLSGQPYSGLGKQGTQLNLNTDTIGDIKLPVPPIDRQRAIVIFLDRETLKIDALVEKVQQAIERLQELRAALISAAVTGKIDMREEFDSVDHAGMASIRE